MSPLKRTFWLGAGLILLSNAVALGGVYYNRSGEPDSVLRLSERELAKSYSQVMDDSDFAGQVLELEFTLAKGWITVDKLRALGFDVDDEGTRVRGDREERDGLVVLELAGAQYQKELSDAQLEVEQAQRETVAQPQSEKAQASMEMAQHELERLREADTRLYVVDAGLDAASLREQYPDRSRYTVARASLRMGWRWTSTGERYTLYPRLPELSVPSRWSTVFEAWQPYDRDAEERSKVSVELAFGKRFEPWITAAKTVE